MGSLGWGEMQRFGDAGQGMAGYRRGAALFDTHAPDRADTCTCRYLLPAQTGRAPPALMLARFQSHCYAFSLGAEDLDQSEFTFSGIRYHAFRYRSERRRAGK